MATIVTRAGKGSALTWVEGDANFTNLNTDKIEAVADDTAPALGGDLDVGSYSIITSDISGIINIGGPISLADIGEGSAVVSGASATGIALMTNLGDDTGPIVSLVTGLTPGVNIISNGSTTIDGLTYPSTDGTNGQVLTTNGAGVLSFTSLPSIPTDTGDLTNNAGFITATPGTSLNLEANSIRYNSSSSTGLTFTTEGYTKQIMKTYNEFIHVSTTTTGTWAPNAADGPIQYVAMTGNLTINGFTSPSGGQTITILLDGTGGSYTLTLGANILKAGGSATLTDGGFDVLTISCVDDETPTYLASLATNFS